MKKGLNLVLFIALFLLKLNDTTAQNLQFSQVLTFNGQGIGDIPIGTVPAGKVWKVETWSNNNEVSLLINGTLFNNHYLAVWSNNNGNQMQLSSNLNPIWLKSADVLSFFAYNQWGQQRPYFISIIEFNIIP